MGLFSKFFIEKYTVSILFLTVSCGKNWKMVKTFNEHDSNYLAKQFTLYTTIMKLPQHITFLY